jgi:hypothetical protein
MTAEGQAKGLMCVHAPARGGPLAALEPLGCRTAEKWCLLMGHTGGGARGPLQYQRSVWSSGLWKQRKAGCVRLSFAGSPFAPLFGDQD